MLHGEPPWSHLYPKTITILATADLRTVAVDLVGCGRSDKPADREDYTYQAHINWTWAVIEEIGLDAITLVSGRSPTWAGMEVLGTYQPTTRPV